MRGLRERMDDDAFDPEVHDAVLAALDQLSDIVTSSQVGPRAANEDCSTHHADPCKQSGETLRAASFPR